MSGRNPYTSIKDEPITRKAVESLSKQLDVFWEDTMLVTEPNKHPIIAVGNLEAILDTLLACKDFDNPQLMMGDPPR